MIVFCQWKMWPKHVAELLFTYVPSMQQAFFSPEENTDSPKARQPVCIRYTPLIEVNQALYAWSFRQ